MNKNGPIVVIEDDKDDQEILDMIFKKLKYDNPVVFFQDGHDALDYLNRTDVMPFLILSDINMPRIDGFELRSKVQSNKELLIKCIPYVFFTTTSSNKSVIEAYNASVQGFFVKPAGIDQMESTIRKIMEYWKEALCPAA